MQVVSYVVFLMATGLLHIAQRPQGPYLMGHVPTFPSFLSLSHVISYNATLDLSAYQRTLELLLPLWC